MNWILSGVLLAFLVLAGLALTTDPGSAALLFLPVIASGTWLAFRLWPREIEEQMELYVWRDEAREDKAA